MVIRNTTGNGTLAHLHYLHHRLEQVAIGRRAHILWAQCTHVCTSCDVRKKVREAIVATGSASAITDTGASIATRQQLLAFSLIFGHSARTCSPLWPSVPLPFQLISISVYISDALFCATMFCNNCCHSVCKSNMCVHTCS